MFGWWKWLKDMLVAECPGEPVKTEPWELTSELIARVPQACVMCEDFFTCYEPPQQGTSRIVICRDDDGEQTVVDVK